MSDLRQRAIELYDAFTHEHHDRRKLLTQMVALAGSIAAAEVLIAGIAASPASAAMIDPADPRLTAQDFIGKDGVRQGYWAKPSGRRGRLSAVMVIHENRGLTPHIQDVTRKLALAGFYAFAPDFLAPLGGTPADQNMAREMFSKLDLAAAIANGVAMIETLAMGKSRSGKVGAIGFCWGGAMVNRLAVAAAGKPLAACVPYYGSAPNPAEAPKVTAAVMQQLAGLDTRVNGTALPWGDALKAAGKNVTTHVYDGANHAFNNDTSVERYSKPVADLAWERTTSFLHARLDGR